MSYKFVGQIFVAMIRVISRAGQRGHGSGSLGPIKAIGQNLIGQPLLAICHVLVFMDKGLGGILDGHQVISDEIDFARDIETTGQQPDGVVFLHIGKDGLSPYPVYVVTDELVSQRGMGDNTHHIGRLRESLLEYLGKGIGTEDHAPLQALVEGFALTLESLGGGHLLGCTGLG